MSAQDPFAARQVLKTQAGPVTIWRLSALAKAGLGAVDRLPYSLKVLLENLLRHVDGFQVTADDVRRLAAWEAKAPAAVELPFTPARVILQDFTGVPCLVDLAAMRSGLARAGGDPTRINPLVPCDLVIDHSVQVDAYGSPEALSTNIQKEFERNRERYEFLRWGAKAFRNFRVVPPGTGIVHQVNLEYLASVVMTKPANGDTVAFPDTLVGTDSHTTMVNGLGVLGWGVGGIEAEAAMLGQPVPLAAPEVVGFRLTGRLREGATATDLVLTVTQMLRARGVVGKFVEFYGPGLSSMSLADRATVANMAPEYGATIGFFPVDQETLAYLKFTGRPPMLVDLVERYTKEQGLFRTDATPSPEFTETVELDLGTVEPSLAGPRRPQDRVPLAQVGLAFRKAVSTMQAGAAATNHAAATIVADDEAEGLGAAPPSVAVKLPNGEAQLTYGSVVIAAITSCTNTSNPSVMLGAGLLAKKAVERGLTVKPYVKTSLAPGSGVVTEYLKRAGLDRPLEQLGFHLVGYGCLTCIGNSGPLPEAVEAAVRQHQLVVAAVLSGNRNFEGRIHPLVRANYLASPPLVVAYALAGTVDLDLTRDPLGHDAQGRPVYLKEIWPSPQEVADCVRRAVTPEMFRERYARVCDGNDDWNRIGAGESTLYPWNPSSAYIQEPPYLTDLPLRPRPIQPIGGARVLVMVGDSVTTDHISPAGSIAKDSPAGQYLIAQGVDPKDFNSYGARRGNDRVMTRGTFANVRLKNELAPETEGWWTTYLPTGEKTSIYEAAMKYKAAGIPLLVLAGKEYGAGSSRDWAAKGTALLGVRAVIAESYERIHRSNLIGMGVLPLEFPVGQSRSSLKITGRETFDLLDASERLAPGQTIEVKVTSPDGKTRAIPSRVRIDTPVELEYYRHGGILPYVLRKFLS